jgi:aryl-alcohol dehydrogenase-like predicted oxidoreductase
MTDDNTFHSPASDRAFTLGGDLKVNRMGLGAMRVALGGAVRDHDGAVAVIRRAAELRVNHFDSAGFYGVGDLRAHEAIREALSPYAEDVVIATKVGPLFADGLVPAGDAGPEDMRRLVEEDLRRLGVDRLDLVYLRVGGMGPVGGESVAARYEALANLRDEGLIRHLGLSNVDSAQLREAQTVAPVAAVQNRFNVHHRVDASLLEECERGGIAYVPFFPLGGGDAPIDWSALTPTAARNRVDERQVALSWLLSRSPAILAIPGTSSIAHLEANVAASLLRLPAEELSEIASIDGTTAADR